MVNRFAANLLFLAHCGISLYALFGAFLVTPSSLWLWLHVAVVLWIAAMNVANWSCPLTTWEQACRRAAKQHGSAGFIQRLFRPLLPAMRSSRRLEVAVGATILLWNAAIYVVVFVAR